MVRDVQTWLASLLHAQQHVELNRANLTTRPRPAYLAAQPRKHCTRNFLLPENTTAVAVVSHFRISDCHSQASKRRRSRGWVFHPQLSKRCPDFEIVDDFEVVNHLRVR